MSRGSIRRQFAAVAVALVLAGSLAACAPPASNGSNSGEGDGGGTLTIGMPGNSSETIDPHITNAASSDLLRAAQLFDGLTRVTNDGDIEMALAESMTPNEDNTVWTVTLRPDVKMHDGSTLTSDDVIASIERIIDPDNAARGANLLSFVSAEGLEKVDDLTFTVTLAAPYGPFPNVWSSNYLRIAKAGFDPDNPIGTGPFMYKSFTPGQSLTFVRFDDYWDCAPLVEQLDVIGFADSDAITNALRGGQIDIAYQVPLAQAESLESTDGINILESETGLYLPIVMRTDQAPFNDPRVREAMKLIADRDQLVGSALAGHGRVANDYISGYGFCPDVDLPQRTQDIDRAKELLAEAGQSDLTFDLATTPGTTGMVDSAVIFAEQAKEAGVTVNVNQLDEASYLDNYLGWTAAVDFYSSPYLELVPLTLLPGGGGNASHWDDPEFGALAAELFATSDQDAQCAIIDQMKTIEYERGPNIVWGFVNVLNAYSDKVSGLEPDVTGHAPFHLTTVSVED